MRDRQRRQVLAGVVCALLLATACASAKKQVVIVHRSVETALGQLQDAERALYQKQTIPQLTLERHQQISTVFAEAFGVQIKVGEALLIWRSDQPVPAEVLAYFDEAERVLVEIQRLLPDNARVQLAREIVAWAKEVVALAKALKRPPPPTVAIVAERGIQ
jgi:hypothetical protein